MKKHLGGGYLAKNKYKKSENHPDYMGKVTVNDQKMDLAGWIKKGKDGTSYIGLFFNPPYVKEGASEKPDKTEIEVEPAAFDDDIPF